MERFFMADKLMHHSSDVTIWLLPDADLKIELKKLKDAVIPDSEALSGVFIRNEKPLSYLFLRSEQAESWLIAYKKNNPKALYSIVTPSLHYPPLAAFLKFLAGESVQLFFTQQQSNPEKVLPQIQAIEAGRDWAKRLVNMPANLLTPSTFVKEAKPEVPGIAVEVLDAPALQKMGMEGILSVGRGSVHQPLLYQAMWSGGGANDKPIVLVGKGVTFDAGGISIKEADGMEDMKMDMAGAAVVLAVVQVAAALKLPINIVALCPVVENMPSGNAYRPSDVITMLSGKTVEIINTDSEGRVILADVLWYAQTKFSPKHIIDVATLTWGIIVALGPIFGGLFANDDVLASQLVDAGNVSGERVWRLPLDPLYDEYLKSDYADIKNRHKDSAAAIIAAQFLQNFIKPQTSWAHIDIAATATGESFNPYGKKRSTGYGVSLLANYLIRNQEQLA